MSLKVECWIKFYFLSAYILEAPQLIKNENGTTSSFSNTQKKTYCTIKYIVSWIINFRIWTLQDTLFTVLKGKE